MKLARQSMTVVTLALLLLTGLGACVTINVYFPAAAAEKAADRIIDEVWGPEAAKPGASSSRIQPLTLQRVAVAIVNGLLPLAHAQQANIEIETPAITSIKNSMKARHGALEPLYNAGGVGLTSDGLISVRDANALSLQQRARANQLVAEENNDRNALYRAIALANGHPEWEQEIRATFARRWVERARAGWWYQQGGAWAQR